MKEFKLASSDKDAASQMYIDTTLRFATGKSISRYVATEEGVMEEYDELDQYGNVLNGITKLLLPKEVFITAYNAYIKEEPNNV